MRLPGTSSWCRAPTTSTRSSYGIPSKVAWLSQTTLSVDETMATVDAIRERFPSLLDPPSDDICYATQNRQLAVKEISPEADLVIVVGSANSSNSVRLAEVALEAGAKAAYRVDDATEIQEAWLEGVARSASPPAPRCPRTSSTAYSRSSPLAATPMPRRCTRPRSR